MLGAKDLKLGYDIDGPDDGEVLILLHAIGTNRFMWNRQWESWRQSYRVIRCDLPGHGHAPLADPNHTIFTLAAAVHELIESLSLDKAHIIGSSLGGMIGLALAIDHPQRVKSLIAADVRADAPEAYQEMWRGLIAKAENEGMDAVAKFMLERWFGVASKGDEQDIRTISNTLTSTQVEGFITSAKAIRQMDFADRLNQINCPVLLLVGENDGVLPQLMSDMSHVIKGANYVKISNAGHLPNIDQPDAFIIAVNEFLARLR